MKCPIHKTEMSNHGRMRNAEYWFCYDCNINSKKRIIIFMEFDKKLIKYHLIEKEVYENE